MRRWHEDRDLMLRRWREEIAKHEGIENYPHMSLAPIPPEKCDDICHCYRGMGFLRKRSVHGCGTPRCTICHYEKFYYKVNRNIIKIKSIQENLDGWGYINDTQVC